MKINDFDKIISRGDILVFFHANWCGKCKIVSLELEKLNNINILKVDADKNRDICKKYGVMSLPTLIYFKKDGSYKTNTGLISYEEIISLTKK